MSESIRGFAEPGFEGVRHAFRANFDAGRDVGAACCLYVDGRPVVDLQGGVADPATGRPYTEETLQLVFSSTKGATAACANLLADRGELDVDAPVAHYWPEFAQAGKQRIPVRWLLDHRAGLIDVEQPLTLEQALAWEPVVEALAAERPQWEPGTDQGYHAMTFGWLVGEVVRRISGRGLGDFFAEEIAAPLDLEFWIGLPDALQPRVASLIDRGLPRRATRDGRGRTPLARALSAPGGAFAKRGLFDRADVRAACLPAVNGVTNARSLARMYAALVGEVDGVRLLSPEQLRAAAVVQHRGKDRVIGFPLEFGLGFMRLAALSKRFGERAIGHYGYGGSMGFADPEYNMAFAFVPNRLELSLVGDARTQGLLRAVNAAVGKWPPRS